MRKVSVSRYFSSEAASWSFFCREQRAAASGEGFCQGGELIAQLNKALAAIDGSGDGREVFLRDALGVIAAIEPALEDGVGTALFDGAVSGCTLEGLQADFATDHFPDGMHFGEDLVAADFDLGVGEDGHGC